VIVFFALKAESQYNSDEYNTYMTIITIYDNDYDVEKIKIKNNNKNKVKEKKR